MAGRPRKPTAAKILEGTWREDRDGDPALVVPAAGEPVCPVGLKGEALSMWERIVPRLVESGVARECDSDQLAAMCRWWARYRLGEKRLEKLQPGHKREYQQTLLVAICWTNFDKIASRFGMTPSDRAKLRLDPSVKKPGGVRSRERKA
jgi:P27 family predicted phage terminase small subunit